MTQEFFIFIVIILFLEILRECRYRSLSKLSAYRTTISAKASTVPTSVSEASVGSVGTHILTVDADGNIRLLPVSNVEAQIGEARRLAEEYTDTCLGSGFSGSNTVKSQIDGKQASGPYLTSHQSLSNYATISSLSSYATISSLSDYATWTDTYNWIVLQNYLKKGSYFNLISKTDERDPKNLPSVVRFMNRIWDGQYQVSFSGHTNTPGVLGREDAQFKII